MERDQRVALLRPYPHSGDWFGRGHSQLGRFWWNWDRAVYRRATCYRLYRQRRAKSLIERSVLFVFAFLGTLTAVHSYCTRVLFSFIYRPDHDLGHSSVFGAYFLGIALM